MSERIVIIGAGAIGGITAALMRKAGEDVTLVCKHMDTAAMEKAFGGNTWTPKAVWVIFGDGSIYMASTHSYPHEVQHITDNNFPGHLCIHFPRTAAQVAAIGPYATKHQNPIDEGWATTRSMIR